MASSLGIIGAGNMGGAIVRGAVAAGVIEPGEVLVVDLDETKRREAHELGCLTSGDPAAVTQAEEILLAVKPQAFPDVARAIGTLREPKVVISIMAGLTSVSIRGALGDKARIVRAMPNTPCQVGVGMTAIALGEGAASGDDALAVALFEALGKTVHVDEKHMHAVTAVSGSGPAYLFLLAEAMERAGESVGLDAVTARLLARQTLLGAATLLDRSVETAATLREAVTSPGGTTEAALKVMFDAGLPHTVHTAVGAALDRSAQLSR